MKEVKKYAWYFPNWHPTPLNDMWHGKGWTEWECVKVARPRFEGHQCPRTPLWGYEDESDPKVFEKKIKAAHDHGIDGFIFDFYWFKEFGAYRIDALNNGFLKAENNELTTFSVMWCNHDPIYVHPANFRNKDNVLTSGSIDAQLMYEVTDYCIKNYFPKPNYQRVDGKIYFGLWDTARFINDFGGENGAAIILDDFRARALKAGFELHIAVCVSGLPGYAERNAKQINDVIKTLGIDSVFGYAWDIPESHDWPKVEYSEFREKNLKKYPEDTKLFDVPCDITVSTGWDTNPRTVQSDSFDKESGYPYSAIVINNTPDEVELSFAGAKRFIDSGKATCNMLTVSTWNEWTEGNFMEPDNLYGYGYLEAFKRVFDK